jgi:hypothetical protein
VTCRRARTARAAADKPAEAAEKKDDAAEFQPLDKVRDDIIERLTNAAVEKRIAAIYDAVKTFSHKALLQLHGRCCSKHWKTRTTFEDTFLRVYKDILLMHELNTNNPPLIFNAFEPPIPIVLLEMLINLTEHQGTRCSEVSHHRDLQLAGPLHQTPHAQIRHPHPRLAETTGFGKPQFALQLAMEWCKAYHEATGCPKEDCCVVFTNTLDVARDIIFKKATAGSSMR